MGTKQKQKLENNLLQSRSHEWSNNYRARVKNESKHIFSNPFPRIKLASNYRFGSVITYRINKIVYHSVVFPANASGD